MSPVNALISVHADYIAGYYFNYRKCYKSSKMDNEDVIISDVPEFFELLKKEKKVN